MKKWKLRYTSVLVFYSVANSTYAITTSYITHLNVDYTRDALKESQKKDKKCAVGGPFR